MLITPNNGEVFVDHSKNRRSGHVGHAMVEYAPGKILAFYANTSAARCKGHSAFGWVEYKRSEDYGKTWSDPTVLEYSMDAFLDGLFTVSCEKAVATEDGTIVLCCQRNECQPLMEPWLTPMYLVSKDGGHTWSEPREMSPEPGRVYDMRYRDGHIYALHVANDASVTFTCNKPEHRYLLLESTDGGESFHEKSVVGFNAWDKGYGALVITPEGRMLAYAYNIKDEFHLDVCESLDFGKTWKQLPPSHCAKRIRNPQIGRLGDTYFLHGRSGCMDDSMPMDFVLYTSKDALHWDAGEYIGHATGNGWGGGGFYSNNLRVCENGREKLLIQASVAYDEARVNIHHWWITMDED